MQSMGCTVNDFQRVAFARPPPHAVCIQALPLNCMSHTVLYLKALAFVSSHYPCLKALLYKATESPSAFCVCVCWLARAIDVNLVHPRNAKAPCVVYLKNKDGC